MVYMCVTFTLLFISWWCYRLFLKYWRKTRKLDPNVMPLLTCWNWIFFLKFSFFVVDNICNQNTCTRSTFRYSFPHFFSLWISNKRVSFINTPIFLQYRREQHQIILNIAKGHLRKWTTYIAICYRIKSISSNTYSNEWYAKM